MTTTKLDIQPLDLLEHLKAARDELDILSGDITLNGETTADSLAEHLDAAIRESKQQAVQLQQLRAQVAELIEERDCYLGSLALLRNQKANTQAIPARRAIALAQAELESATSRYPAMHSAHEGYAILLEEVDELWTEIKRSPRKRDPQAMHAEAVQVAAMALRLIVDVTLPGLEGEG